MLLKEASFFLTIIAVIGFISCRKPYNPPAITSPGSYLVVEGTINTNGVSKVKLSKTVPLSNVSTANPVTGASITVQSSQGASYLLTENTPGNYQSASLTLSNTLQYRLSIATSDGQRYLSDYESVLESPTIDSVGFNVVGSNVQLYVNTHDSTNTTKYYRWDFNETWQFHSEYDSEYITNGQEIVPRTPQQDIYSCFASDTGSNIILASTAHLSNSVVYQNASTSIPSTSEKIEKKYSIQVSQYALIDDAYNFWSVLKEDTENLGSIFDPQPSNISGNVRSDSNSSTPVVGYISVCVVQTKRIFINYQQFPISWSPTYPYSCLVDSEYFAAPHGGFPEMQTFLVPLNSGAIPITQMLIQGTVQGYTASSPDCIDCTLRGTKITPSFWPQAAAFKAAASEKLPNKSVAPGVTRDQRHVPLECPDVFVFML